MKRTPRMRRGKGGPPPRASKTSRPLRDGPPPVIRVRVFPASTALATVVRRAVRVTLTRHGVKRARVHVAIVSDRQMAAWHRRYMGVSGPTDVLTFDASEGDAPEGTSDGWEVEGDIAVSLDTATREARRRGHSSYAEICLYAVHGVLHLLGYDDGATAAAGRMHDVEDDVLRFLGHGAVFQGPSRGAAVKGIPLGRARKRQGETRRR